MNDVVLVTQKLRPGLPGLRHRLEFEVLREAIRAGNERPGFRVVSFSVLSNHLHFVVEAKSTRELSRGMQGLAIRTAKNLNRLWSRSGKVFLERFHARLARGISAIRRTLVYVLQNARKHGVRLKPGAPDPYSSGPWFRFWRGPGGMADELSTSKEPSPVVAHKDLGIELAIVGGLGIRLDDAPADKRRPIEDVFL